MNCSFDNTYKMAWAKAIVELAIQHKERMSFEEIAELYLKYYWNQTIYFDLIQGSNLKKIPEVVRCTKNLIAQYFSRKGGIPERYERIDFSQISGYRETVARIAKILTQDVCYRFMRLSGKEYDLYELNIKARYIKLSKEQVELLAEYSDILLEIINYRWSQMLESFNDSPRISMKVRAIDDGKLRRSSLKPYYKYLDLACNNGSRQCFYCGKPVLESDISVDHVIPWSFMFSDDIWNLVYCHKAENFSKSNSSPTEEDIVRLEERNKAMLNAIEAGALPKDKKYDELKLAIEKDYVRKFWLAAKG